MFFYTDTADSPWMVIKSDDKKRARLNCMHHFLASLPYPNKNTHVIVEDKHILGKTLHPQQNKKGSKQELD